MWIQDPSEIARLLHPICITFGYSDTGTHGIDSLAVRQILHELEDGN